MSAIKTFKLHNGMKVVLWPAHATHTVAVLVLFRTGSRHETRAINGISHFVEHFLFKGTKNRPTHTDVVREFDKVGASYNAFTGKEYTGYYAVLDAADFELALDVLSDILINSTFPLETFEKEKNVIIEEINMDFDNPMRHIFDVWERELYGDQPAGWDIAGTKEGISGMGREQLLQYFKQQYTAPNAILCVAGNMEEKTMRNKITQYFGAAPKRPAKLSKPTVRERQSVPGLFIEERKTDQMHLILGVRGVDIFSPMKYALSILGVILGGNMSSRLWHEIRERRGAAYYVFSEPEFYSDCGYFMTRAGISLDKIGDAIGAILENYKKIAKEGVGRKEIEMAKSFLVGKLHLGLETASEKASFMGLQEVLLDKLLTPLQIERNIIGVSQSDILKAAQHIFRNDKLNLVLIGPMGDEEEIRKILTL